MPDCVIGLVVTVLYCLGGISRVEARGSINTTRWSEGFPSPALGLIGGLVIGGKYHFPSVVIIGSRIASGSSLVGTWTNCFRLGDKLVIGVRFNRFVSPAIMNCISDPYLADRK